MSILHRIKTLSLVIPAQCSGIPELKGYLNGIHVKGLLVRCQPSICITLFKLQWENECLKIHVYLILLQTYSNMM
jgi:hypothetical protein